MRLLARYGQIRKLGNIQAAAAWTPLSESGLKVWYRYDSMLNAAGVQAVNNDPVKTVVDKSGQANNAIQVTTANMATWKANQQNGLAGLSFNGSTNVYAFTSFDLPAFTIFTVLKPLAPSVSFPGVAHMRVGAQNGFNIVNANTVGSFQPDLCIWNGVAQTASKQSGTTYAWNSGVYTMIWNSSPVLEINGAGVAISDRAGGFAGAEAQLGQGYGAGGLIAGVVFEFGIYDHVLAAGVDASLTGYIRSLYANY